MQIRNRSRFAAEGMILFDREGRDCWSIAIKARVALCDDGPLGSVGAGQIERTDRYDSAGALVAPADFRPEWVGTDVVLRGTAVPPPGTEASFAASLRIGDREADLRCHGPRGWRREGERWVARELAPVAPVPLCAEAAFGGEGEPRNPLGRGFVADAGKGEHESVELPRLEWADDPLVDPLGRPAPALVGCVAPHWLPRRAFAGTYDEEWARARAPLPAHDQDPRYFRAGSERLWFSSGLRGGEQLTLENLGHPARREWTMPRLAPRLLFEGRWIQPRLDLVVLDVDLGELALTFGASIEIDGRIDERLIVDVSEPTVAPLGVRAEARR